MAPTTQQRMIHWTFALVLVLGALSAIFMLHPPPTERNTRTKDRNPASIAMTLVEFKRDGASAALDLTLPCTPNGPQPKEKNSVSLEVRQIRLSGTNCLRNDEIASTEVRNEANGFSATVFQPTPNTFTTDYISLAKGSNRIRILHIYKRGARVEQDYEIERQNE